VPVAGWQQPAPPHNGSSDPAAQGKQVAAVILQQLLYEAPLPADYRLTLQASYLSYMQAAASVNVTPDADSQLLPINSCMASYPAA
jgi:hypothetical protein